MKADARNLPDPWHDPRAARFLIPVPPTANSLFTNAPGKGRARTPAYRSWSNTAGWLIKAQNVGPVPGKHWSLLIEAPINHTRDLDNVAKPTCDLLVRLALISDDRYIDEIILWRIDPKKWLELVESDHMRVTITPL